MLQFKKITTLAVALAAATILSGSASALAHGGSDDNDQAETSSTSQSSNSGNSGRKQSLDPERKAEFEHRANQEIEKKRDELKDKKAKNSEERHQRCESHKQGLNTKFNRIVTKSQKIQTRIDNIFAKATAYKDSSNLDPENWSTLLAAAQAAKTTSASSIADLQAISPTIDCNSDSVASDVATFKAAATKTRDDLKAYKTSVKALLKSLKEAKESSTTQDEGSAQ